MWGEHESKYYKTRRAVNMISETKYFVLVDYIFMIKADVDLDVSPNEVRDVRYVTPDELRAMFADTSVPMTPWFKLICNTFLFKWWANIDSLESKKDENTIHRLGFD
jgi:isopentenyl-diphosphate delta-isomerase